MNVIPFSSGTQYADWEEFNCCHCRKYPQEEEWLSEEGRKRICPIALAMSEGYFKGSISQEIAKRAAYPGSGPYNWRCGEFETDGTGKEEPENAIRKRWAEIIGAYVEGRIPQEG